MTTHYYCIYQGDIWIITREEGQYAVITPAYEGSFEVFVRVSLSELEKHIHNAR